ncbi:hypothetical protein [Marinomonas sp. CT5]|uniref:hypothetical protein n=1 Tax=Marinomonas sp. CT5 TaxID=2066133 RepID=UPI001BAEE0DF|nr:hypothetical protein [Marinomonas sp. CT5]
MQLTPDLTWNNRLVYNRVTLEQRGTRQSTAPVSNTDEVLQTVNTFGYDAYHSDNSV